MIRLKRVGDNLDANVDELFEGNDVLVLGYLFEKVWYVGIVNKWLQGHSSQRSDRADRLGDENSC